MKIMLAVLAILIACGISFLFGKKAGEGDTENFKAAAADAVQRATEEIRKASDTAAADFQKREELRNEEWRRSISPLLVVATAACNPAGNANTALNAGACKKAIDSAIESVINMGKDNPKKS